ncbi:hypothetical protein llap_15419 [Limosa lapponica baueri]|uniref:Uncharacterized protein n=1 Tax=Limosa lapponica baueri TaxID=1758121 RepID=A0A2I0TKE5_LIMLA|nr:hypothetical protein llap_15419 [Limosa lapponica baueri]
MLRAYGYEALEEIGQPMDDMEDGPTTPEELTGPERPTSCLITVEDGEAGDELLCGNSADVLALVGRKLWE